MGRSPEQFEGIDTPIEVFYNDEYKVRIAVFDDRLDTNQEAIDHFLQQEVIRT